MGKRKKALRPAAEAEGLVYRKNKYAAPVGFFWLALVAIGIVALAIFCVRFTLGLLDNTKEKERFEQIIYPVIMFDPVPFENPADADPLMLLQASLWSTLLGEKRDSYQENDLGWKIVPASDVDVACARLFGPEAKLEHQTITNYVDTTYTYDEDTKTYYVPVQSVTPFYTPSILSVVKKGDLFTLEVGYVPPANAWTQAGGKNQEPEIQKTLLYDLLKVKDHYQITAIRDHAGAAGQAAGWGAASQAA